MVQHSRLPWPVGFLTLLLFLPCSGLAAETGAEGGPVTIVLWQPGDPGERLNLRGRVVGSDGRPLAGARVTLWQADGTGNYRDQRYRAAFETGKGGDFRLATVLPGQYYGAKHIHVMLDHPGYRSRRTRVLFKGDPYLNARQDEQAIVLEELHAEDETIWVGGVEFVMQPLGSN